MLGLSRPRFSRGSSTGEASACSSAVSSVLSSSDGDDGDQAHDATMRRPAHQSLLLQSVEESIHSTTNGTNNKHLSGEFLRMSAIDNYKSAFEGSKLPDKSSTFPRFDTREVHIGKLLGSGGFSNVYEIYGFTLRKDFEVDMTPTVEFRIDKTQDENEDSEHQDEVAIEALGRRLDMQHQQASRRFLGQHCFRRRDDTTEGGAGYDDGDDNVVARYALKRLKPSVIANPPTLLQGISDMATESRFLASLELHPHIVKIRGMAQDRFHEGYFIIMDRLGDTLEQRMTKVWKPAMKKAYVLNKVLNKVKYATSTPTNKRRYQYVSKWKNNDTLLQRLAASVGIASALAHLHKYSILYRDLKPENCGFDVRDDVKIFDFGLARELPYEKVDDTSNSGIYDINKKKTMFQLTAMCGTPRYMAPEVALGESYNESCDVYSFAILCWQILRLKKPYGKKCSFDVLQQVWTKGEKVRPPIPDYWPRSVSQMLQKAFLSDPSKRPSMQEMESVLIREFESQSQPLSSSPEDTSNITDSFSSSHRAGTHPEKELLAEEKEDSSTLRKSLDVSRRRSTHVFGAVGGLGMKNADFSNLADLIDDEDDDDESSHDAKGGDSGTTDTRSASFRTSDGSSSATTNNPAAPHHFENIPTVSAKLHES